jgi:shikimate kinase
LRSPNRRRPPVTLTRHIALVGMMGSGKTTVGHALARRLGWPMIDTDAEIVRLVGMSIPEVFTTQGEVWFRAKETEVLSDCLRSETPAILSVGGGTVLAAHNRVLLRSWADVVWLRASLATLTTRVGSGAGRPILAGDPTTVLARLFTERAPVYAEVAGVVVDVDDRPTRSVVSEVIRGLSTARRP